jgi:hypothetical protein
VPIRCPWAANGVGVPFAARVASMGIHLRRPHEGSLHRLLERSASDRLTYQPIGCSFRGGDVAGLRRRHWHEELEGSDAFERARMALGRWVVHRRAGIDVLADGPLQAGTTVAMSAPVGGLHVDIACRVVVVVDGSGRRRNHHLRHRGRVASGMASRATGAADGRLPAGRRRTPLSPCDASGDRAVMAQVARHSCSGVRSRGPRNGTGSGCPSRPAEA